MRVSEKERLDFNYVLIGLNTTMEYITKPLPKDMLMSQVDEYYSALMEAFKEYKMKEHKLRCEFSDKYHVPYDFAYNDGEIPTEPDAVN